MKQASLETVCQRVLRLRNWIDADEPDMEFIRAEYASLVDALRAPLVELAEFRRDAQNQREALDEILPD